MSFYLLLGAGFSRNWGGWLAAESFEYLLGRPEIASNEPLRMALWKAQAKGGFEDALADLQVTARTGDSAAVANLADLQIAVLAMFDDMNAGYYSNPHFEFSNLAQRSVAGFLAHFDAIFTLNQDLLLEHHYLSNDPSLRLPGKWNGVAMPGVRATLPIGANGNNSWARRWYEPIPPAEFIVPKGAQPTFKLHGSSNWREADGNSMLVMGGNKARAIGLSPILSWYQQQFEERLSEAGARLMVIGYGFRDEHINEIIMRAINHRGLRMFVIVPEGASVARAANPTASAAIYCKTALEESFEIGLIGASRRGLREIFGSDDVEFAKVIRFFDD